MNRSALCLVGLFLVSACSLFTWEHRVRSEATTDLACPEKSITVTEVSGIGGRWDASGCGAKASYRCWSANGGAHCSRIEP